MAQRMVVTDVELESPEGDARYYLRVVDPDGREGYLLENGVPLARPWHRAKRLAMRIKAKGSIDPDLWSWRSPYGTNAWLLDGCEERQIEDEKQFGW